MWRRSILQPYIDNPRHITELYIAHSDQFVIIKDKYPKAKAHYLVLPRIEPIPLSIHRLAPKDIPKLKEMHRFATTELIKNGVQVDELKFGFHVKPSLEPLHMHIISPDLSHVTRKEHWWSFTDGFLPFDMVLELLETERLLELQHFITVKIDYLTCDRCEERFKHLRDLKSHRSKHF